MFEPHTAGQTSICPHAPESKATPTPQPQPPPPPRARPCHHSHQLPGRAEQRVRQGAVRQAQLRTQSARDQLLCESDQPGQFYLQRKHKPPPPLPRFTHTHTSLQTTRTHTQANRHTNSPPPRLKQKTFQQLPTAWSRRTTRTTGHCATNHPTYRAHLGSTTT